MSTSLRRSLAAAFVCAGLASAQAQTSAPAAPVAPAAPAPAAAPRADLSPEHMAIAAEVVRLSGMSRSIDIVVPSMVERARQMFTQSRPELASELKKTIETLEPDFKSQNNEAQRVAALAFGHRLSIPELQELKTFFSSPVGKRFVESQPAIVDEMFKNLDEFSQRLGQVVVDKVREDMKKKGHSL